MYKNYLHIYERIKFFCPFFGNSQFSVVAIKWIFSLVIRSRNKNMQKCQNVFRCSKRDKYLSKFDSLQKFSCSLFCVNFAWRENYHSDVFRTENYWEKMQTKLTYFPAFLALLLDRNHNQVCLICEVTIFLSAQKFITIFGTSKRLYFSTVRAHIDESLIDVVDGLGRELLASTLNEWHM